MLVARYSMDKDFVSTPHGKIMIAEYGREKAVQESSELRVQNDILRSQNEILKLDRSG